MTSGRDVWMHTIIGIGIGIGIGIEIEIEIETIIHYRNDTGTNGMEI